MARPMSFSPFLIHNSRKTLSPLPCHPERSERSERSRGISPLRGLAAALPCHPERSERSERSRGISLLRSSGRDGRDFSTPGPSAPPVEMTKGRPSPPSKPELTRPFYRWAIHRLNLLGTSRNRSFLLTAPIERLRRRAYAPERMVF